MLEVLPGDVATRILGRDATPEALAAAGAAASRRPRRSCAMRHGWAESCTGHLGHSLASARPITTILAPRIFNTVLLSIYAFILYMPLALIPALIQAVRRDRPVDHAFSVITLVLLSMPDFLLGTLLLSSSSSCLPILPAMSLVDDSSGVAANICGP